MKVLRLLCAGALIAMTGCYTIGPVVTSVSSDGNGGLIVEKTMIKHGSFLHRLLASRGSRGTAPSIDEEVNDSS